MIDTLNSIYLRLDVDMQSLASKAIAQIIVKLVYSNKGRMSKNDIKAGLAKVNGGKSFNDEEIDEVLKELSEKELRYHKGWYSLSTSKRENIDKSINESDERRSAIIDKFFSGLNTEKSLLEEWLTEMTLKFFEAFSNEWISDLLARTDQICCSADSIREQVTNRTKSMKLIDKDDKELLPQRFFTFVNSHEDIVDAYLWEYGTSAFASKLIRNKHGVDKLTLETFKGSFCVLDTNVLLFIALENKYKGSFKAIEKVFEDLNVKAGILYITKREYENKVNSQRYETLSNLEKFGYEVTSMPDDDFTMAAIQSGCRDKSDFERFFKHKLSLPGFLYERVSIDLKDDDKALAKTIETAQAEQSLMDKLNDISRRICRRPKRDSACKHDIGLLEGVRYLRDSEDPVESRSFILSDDTSINQYSKDYGLKNGLPLSLRVDTLINMLAINNGGDTFDAADYRPLFANIIRLGLTPRKETFRQTELYQLSQMNGRIAKLPSYEVCTIAKEMHRRFLEGMNEDEIRRDLNEMVTKGEVSARDEVKNAEAKLAFESKQKEEYKAKGRKDRKNLEAVVRSQIEKEYDAETYKTIIWWWIRLTIVFLVLAIVFVLVYKTKSNGSLLEALIMGILGNAILEVVTGVIVRRRVIYKRKRLKEKTIDDEVTNRLDEMDKSE